MSTVRGTSSRSEHVVYACVPTAVPPVGLLRLRVRLREHACYVCSISRSEMRPTLRAPPDNHVAGLYPKTRCALAVVNLRPAETPIGYGTLPRPPAARAAPDRLPTYVPPLESRRPSRAPADRHRPQRLHELEEYGRGADSHSGSFPRRANSRQTNSPKYRDKDCGSVLGTGRNVSSTCRRSAYPDTISSELK